MAEPFTYNEKQAVKLLIEGRPEGLQAIYNRYAFSVSRIGWKFLRSKELTDDFVQEVFIKVWVNRKKFETVESVERYLTTICRNKALDHLKDAKVRKFGENEYARTKLTSEHHLELLDKECYEVLQTTVDKMPTTQKRVYELVTTGLSHKEVADQLNISLQTVSNSMAEVLKAAKKHLGHQIVTVLFVVIPSL